MSDSQDFREFFADFVRRHSDLTTDEIKLNATPYQLMVLGEFLAQGMASWALGVDMTNERRLFCGEVPARNECDEARDGSEDFTISISWETKGGAA